jgi:hypothetical protein
MWVERMTTNFPVQAHLICFRCFSGSSGTSKHTTSDPGRLVCAHTPKNWSGIAWYDSVPAARQPFRRIFDAAVIHVLARFGDT